MFKKLQIWNYKDVIKLSVKRPCEMCNRHASTNREAKLIDKLVELTDCKRADVMKSLHTENAELQFLSDADIDIRIQTLKEANLHSYNSLKTISLLREYPITLKNHVLFLEEAGFVKEMILPFALTKTKFSFLANTKIEFLKENGFIHKDTDVMENMLGYIDLEVQHQPRMKDIPDPSSIVKLKTAVLQAYLKHRINIPDERLNPKLNHMVRLRYKSLQLLSKNIEICEKIFGYSHSKIYRNSFLLFMNTDNVYRIINEIPVIGDENIISCLQNHPKVLDTNVDNIKQTIQHIKDAGIPESCISTTPEILTLSAENVRQRLDVLNSCEFLTCCRYHPRVLKLVYYQQKVNKRLKLLKEIKLNYRSLVFLCRTENSFEKYCEKGMERIKVQDVIRFISAELACDGEQLKRQLSKNPYWAYINIVQIGKNLKFLKTKFTNEEILKSVIIILYPQEKILNELNNIELRQELNIYKINGQLRQELLLPLVLYYLERETNFSGNGIWDEEADITPLGIDMPVPIQLNKGSITTRVSV